MKYLLDTNACIAILKGADIALRKKLDQIELQNIFICSIVKAELLLGARKSASVDRNLEKVLQFCAGLESLPFEDMAAEYYGITRNILERLGTPIGNADLFISSIALVHDLTVMTKNFKEFVRVPGLKVESW